MTLLNWSHVYNNEKIIKRSYSVDPYLQLLWLIPLGFFAGGYGTLTSRKRYKKTCESEWVSPDRWRWCEHRLRFYLQLLRDRRRFSLRACAGVSATLPNSYCHRDFAVCSDDHRVHRQRDTCCRGSLSARVSPRDRAFDRRHYRRAVSRAVLPPHSR